MASEASATQSFLYISNGRTFQVAFFLHFQMTRPAYWKTTLHKYELAAAAPARHASSDKKKHHAPLTPAMYTELYKYQEEQSNSNGNSRSWTHRNPIQKGHSNANACKQAAAYGAARSRLCESTMMFQTRPQYWHKLGSFERSLDCVEWLASLC